MRYVDLQAAFEIEIGKIDKNFEKPKSIDTEYWLNQGLEKFYKTRYSGLNSKGTGFEQDQKRIDDLRTLIRIKNFILDDESWYLAQENSGRFELTPKFFINLEEIPMDKIHASSCNIFYVRVPKHYTFLLGDSAGIVPIREEDMRCAQKNEYGEIIPQTSDTLESTIETVNEQFRNSLSEHRIKYGKASPLRLIHNNAIALVTDGNYKVQEYQMIYLRRPNKIDIHNNPLDEYKDMPEHTHIEIVKLAAQMYLENQKDNRYNTYTNEITQME